MKKLIVKPIGGLANRLLVLDSTIKLQQVLKPDNTIIIWERNRNLNCAFKELFHYPDQLQFIETRGFNKFSFRSYSEFYNSFNPSKFRWSFFNKILGNERKFSKIYYSEDMEKLMKEGKTFSPNNDLKSTYISYFARFHNSTDEISTFKPTQKIQDQVDQFVQEFDDNTIGVHIRRMDHKDSINYSPTDGFITKMELEINQTDASFFLSTDSDHVKNKIKNRFGDRIFTRSVKLDRNLTEGIKDAVIDMFCLSKTRAIIGSYNSTFSQVAAEIGRITNHKIYIKNKSFEEGNFGIH